MIHKDDGTSRGTVLVVDDVEINRDILEQIILDMGCKPVLADSGESALKLMKDQQPQLILLDISMPGMSGYELCQKLKESEKTREIPIIFISAQNSSEDIVKGFNYGGEDYITKPFISEEVQARVGARLKLHEMTKELMEMNRKLQISVNAQLKQMEQEKKKTLYVLAEIATQHTLYDKKFIERVGKNCKILAQGMQLSPLFEKQISDTYIDTIGLAASLCDIGNLGIPGEILEKTTDLTAEEAEVLQNHTNIGARLLESFSSDDYNDFINISTDIAKYHHENWDGSGYPEGLKQDAIPLAAQIVSLMIRFCTLTEKGKNSKQDALEIMRAESGKKFNSDIFEICCKISRQFV